MTGITTVIVAKTLVPVALISMTYGVFYLLGSRVLFAGEGAYRKKWRCLHFYSVRKCWCFSEIILIIL